MLNANVYAICDQILKKPGFDAHSIKLAILPEIDYWLNTQLYSTVCLAPKSQSAFYDSLSQTLCKPVNELFAIVSQFMFTNNH